MAPDIDFFGCTGPRLRASGVRTVVDAASLAVVGLLEVVTHIPRIYGEYRKLVAAARAERPALAILTDSPDFHLRVAGQLHKQGIPVVYLVAPQAWAWRAGRVKQIRRTLEHLLCIFPFEEAFFRNAGVRATYIGHPLAGWCAWRSAAMSFSGNTAVPDRPLIAVLPAAAAERRPGICPRFWTPPPGWTGSWPPTGCCRRRLPPERIFSGSA